MLDLETYVKLEMLEDIYLLFGINIDVTQCLDQNTSCIEETVKTLT